MAGGWKYRGRKTFRFGPRGLQLRLTITQAGNRSWSVKVWRYTYNLTRRTSTFDTPGIGAVHKQHRRSGS